MKKMLNLAVFAAISILSIPVLQAVQEQPKAFEDKPALTGIEKAALRGAQSMGILGGGIVGAFAGQQAAAKWLSRDDEPIAIGTIAGISTGGYTGFTAAQSAAIYFLAKLHGVSYRMELISQYYNINLSQYGRLLTAASQKKTDELIKAIDEAYSLRFGTDWKKRLNQLLKQHGGQASFYVEYPGLSRMGMSAKEKSDVRDFVRMLELGAAMANLYYGTKPNPKNTVDSAIKLYKELELLK